MIEFAMLKMLLKADLITQEEYDLTFVELKKIEKAAKESKNVAKKIQALQMRELPEKTTCIELKKQRKFF